MYQPWKLKGYVREATSGEAMQLEKKLKNLSKARLMLFVAKYCNKEGKGTDEA